MSTPNRGPAILLGILITMLCLSLGAIALIVVFNANRPTTEQLTAACKDQVGGAISAEYKQVAEECKKAATPAIKTAAATSRHPGFKYPENVQVVGSFTDVPPAAEYSYVVAIHKDAVLPECTDCDGGPMPSIIMQRAPIKNVFGKETTIDEYIKTTFQATDTLFRNVSVTKENISGSEVTVVKYEYNDDFRKTGVVFAESLYLIKNKTAISVTYYAPQSGVADYIDPSTWQTIRSSLDFSKIE